MQHVLTKMVHYMYSLRDQGTPKRTVNRVENLIGAWSDYLSEQQDQGGQDVTQLTPADIDAWLNSIQALPTRTRQERQRLLTQFLNWAQTHVQTVSKGG